MKARTKKILPLICALLFFASLACGQSNPILAKFNLSKTDGTIFLSWAIASGSTCNGFQITRSTDSVNFTEIGSIPGVCGSTSFEQPYNFTDEQPVKNKVNYYRLALGGNGLSEILSIEIIAIESNGYQIRPNPISTAAKIYFDNNKNQEHQLTIYNLSGNKIFATTSNQDFFLLNTATLQNGTYVFIISLGANNIVVKGKLVVPH